MFRQAILQRWRDSLADGDTLFNDEAIDAVDHALASFEAAAADAAGNPDALHQILRNIVLELDRLGGLEGVHGNFLETDEREELVPYLLEVVAKHGLPSRGEDITEAYRNW